MTKTNNKGFTHPLMLGLIILSLVGLIGFSGHRVWVKNSETKKKVAALKAAEIATENVTIPVADTPSYKTVKKSGTAAAAVTQSGSSQSPAAEIRVDTKYDLKTPLGSLNQLVYELKNFHFGNALYFITPRYMTQTSKWLNVASAITYPQCQANATCNKILSTELAVINTNQLFPYTGANGQEGMTVVFNLTEKDGVWISQHPRYGGEYRVRVDMLNVGDNWVVDSLTVNDYTI